jgi:hypothetical protein
VDKHEKRSGQNDQQQGKYGVLGEEFSHRSGVGSVEITAGLVGAEIGAAIDRHHIDQRRAYR